MDRVHQFHYHCVTATVHFTIHHVLYKKVTDIFKFIRYLCSKMYILTKCSPTKSHHSYYEPDYEQECCLFHQQNYSTDNEGNCCGKKAVAKNTYTLKKRSEIKKNIKVKDKVSVLN
jgi:hypothetical protein